MTRRQASRRLCVASALLAAASPGPLPAAEQDWLPLLRTQAKAVQNCDLQHLVSSRELTVGNAVAVEGRLRCIDGREYDFTRPRPHMKFEFRLCQPAVC